jgi:hypothetical protein
MNLVLATICRGSNTSLHTVRIVRDRTARTPIEQVPRQLEPAASRIPESFGTSPRQSGRLVVGDGEPASMAYDPTMRWRAAVPAMVIIPATASTWHRARSDSGPQRFEIPTLARLATSLRPNKHERTRLDHRTVTHDGRERNVCHVGGGYKPVTERYGHGPLRRILRRRTSVPVGWNLQPS